jgi:hypothetical protein
MSTRKTLSMLLTALVAAGPVAYPVSADARMPLAALSAVSLDEPAAVLGLDGSDDAMAKSLTEELRRAFGRRGLGGSEELSLAEVRLTMGCEGNDPTCLAEAGRSIGVEFLIFGELSPSGGGYTLTLHILNVPKGIEETATTRPLTKDQLSSSRIGQTANEIVDSLFPKDEEEFERPPPASVVTTDPDDPTVEPRQRDEPRRSKLVWGPYSPRPKWKWAGFGVGLGLTVVGAVGAGVTAAMLQGNLRDEVFGAAEASLNDCIVVENGEPKVVACESSTEPRFVENDVDPSMMGDLCAYAGETGLDPRDPSAVRNEQVTNACLRADAAQKINIASFAVLGAGAALTIVFTTLLFVHRDNSVTRAMRTRDVRIGAAPNPGGGLTLSGGFRF